MNWLKHPTVLLQIKISLIIMVTSVTEHKLKKSNFSLRLKDYNNKSLSCMRNMIKMTSLIISSLQY